MDDNEGSLPNYAKLNYNYYQKENHITMITFDEWDYHITEEDFVCYGNCRTCDEPCPDRIEEFDPEA